MEHAPWWFYPFLMCLVVTGMLGYLGIHVLTRKVIFVDLATAQIHLLDSVERAHAYLLALRDDSILREFAFVNYDDNDYVTANGIVKRGLTADHMDHAHPVAQSELAALRAQLRVFNPVAPDPAPALPL